MNNEKFKSLLRLSTDKRYEYSLKTICDFEEVFYLKANSKVLIWPNKEFAENYSKNSRFEKITLEDFLDTKFFSEHAEIFPTQSNAGLEIPLNNFKEEIKKYLDEWY